MLILRALTVGLCLAGLAPYTALEAQASNTLLIPFNTSFSHSDHHWIAWMPTHPVYEAVEVRSSADPASSSGAAVRVFFTERAGGKNQVYYFNSEAAARAFRGQGHFRVMDVKVVGDPGGPVNLDLSFHDKDNRPVALSLHFAPGQPLSDQHAGLTNQMGHNAETLFLIFFREKAASAAENRLVMDGQDYSINAERAASAEQLSRTGYRSNIFSVTFVYGTSQYQWKDGALNNSWRRSFTPLEGAQGELYRSTVADGTTIEAVTNSAGELREYRHLTGKHTFRMTFQPALPSLHSAQDGRQVRYQASIDSFGVLVEGTALIRKSADQLTIDWRHESPVWAMGYHFQSVVHPTPTGYDLVVRKLPPPSQH